MPRKKTHEEFVKDFNSLFENEYEVVGQYVNAVTPIDIKHKKCNYVFSRIPNNILSRKKCYCPKCYSKKVTNTVLQGVNDIYTTNKRLYSLLENKDDGFKYREHSNLKTYFRCPNCNCRIYAAICDVNSHGLSCPNCGDGYSYPEKFMYNLLTQLEIPFDYQWQPDWLKPYYYDFHFIMNDNSYVIEMDGQLGHGNKAYDTSKDTEGLKRDIIKDKLAIQHSITIIRIDCAYKTYKDRFNYIKENIIECMGEIFDLSRIDYSLCDKTAKISFVINISDLWNKGIRGYENIRKHYQLNRSTIRYYLKTASELGLINESYDEVLKINRKYSNLQLAKTKGKAVRCDQTGEEFYSYASARRKYKVDLFNYFNPCSNSKYCGILSDGTRLTWTKIE